MDKEWQMNIGIVGCNGYIGRYLSVYLSQRTGNKIINIGHGSKNGVELELKDAKHFNYGILKDVDIIIDTAAISSPDKCAEEYDYCRDINVIGTQIFIENAISCGTRVLFFSSDAIYGKDQGIPFNEMSTTAPVTAYGMMKKEVEDMFKGCDLFKSLRLSYVMSDDDKFTRYCLKCMHNGIEANIYHPFYRNVVSIKEVLNVVEWMISNWENYHYDNICVAGSELISRVRIADEINRLSGNALHYFISEPDSEFYNNRPAITEMRSLFLYKNKILEEVSITKKMQEVLNL